MPEHSRRPSPSSQACSAWRSGSAIGVCARNSISTTRSSTTDVPILDSQVHAYERNHPGRPWFGTLYGPPEVTGDQMVAAMDAVGVDGAILASPSACIAANDGAADQQRARAAAVFMTEDPRAARQLLGEKEVFREIETRTTEEYFGRARTNRAENIEMGKLLLDIEDFPKASHQPTYRGMRIGVRVQTWSSKRGMSGL